MRRKVNRDEVQATVVNLIDLNFSAAAVGFMLNKTMPNIYTHLKNAGRMNGRTIIRRPTSKVLESSQAAMRRLSSNPEWAAASILTTPWETASGGTPRASVIQSISRGSGKKAV